jgi:hypothetical protein
MVAPLELAKIWDVYERVVTLRQDKVSAKPVTVYVKPHIAGLDSHWGTAIL